MKTPIMLSSRRCLVALHRWRQGKKLDVFGSQPGYVIQQADAKQAYTQALFQGVATWVRLPRNRWPKEWKGMKDPVVPLKLALYGHPDSGGIWERHCETELKKVGLEAEAVLTDIWKSVFLPPYKEAFAGRLCGRFLSSLDPNRTSKRVGVSFRASSTWIRQKPLGGTLGVCTKKNTTSCSPRTRILSDMCSNPKTRAPHQPERRTFGISIPRIC